MQWVLFCERHPIVLTLYTLPYRCYPMNVFVEICYPIDVTLRVYLYKCYPLDPYYLVDIFIYACYPVIVFYVDIPLWMLSRGSTLS